MARSAATKINEAIQKFVVRVMQKLTTDTVANLQRAPSQGGTPVDTGWARANWIPSVGTPVNAPAGTRADAEAGKIDTNAVPQGVSQVLSYSSIKLGNIYISNNVPYIELLNAGTSQQAPPMFVEMAIEKAITQDLLRGLRRRS